MGETICPLCKCTLKNCQCLYTGSAHTDKQKIYEVVRDHLYLLSKEQLTHIIELQHSWQIDYEDKQLNEILTKMNEECKQW